MMGPREKNHFDYMREIIGELAKAVGVELTIGKMTSSEVVVSMPQDKIPEIRAVLSVMEERTGTRLLFAAVNEQPYGLIFPWDIEKLRDYAENFKAYNAEKAATHGPDLKTVAPVDAKVGSEIPRQQATEK